MTDQRHEHVEEKVRAPRGQDEARERGTCNRLFGGKHPHVMTATCRDWQPLPATEAVQYASFEKFCLANSLERTGAGWRIWQAAQPSQAWCEEKAREIAEGLFSRKEGREGAAWAILQILTGENTSKS